MIVINKLQKPKLPSMLYNIVKQLFTPPQLQALSDLTFFVNFFGNVFQQNNSGLTFFKRAYFTESFNTAFYYMPCCTTKYIFVLGKNKFDRVGASYRYIVY